MFKIDFFYNYNDDIAIILKVFPELQAALYYTSIKSSFNEKYYANSTMSVFNDSSGASMLSGSAVLMESFAKTVSFVTLRIKLNDQDEEYQREVLQSTIDTCTVSKGLFGTIFVKQFIENVANYSNLPLSCPVRAGTYYGTNVPLPKVFLPQFIFTNNLQWEIVCILKARKTKSSRLVHHITWVVRGIYNKN